MIEPGLLKFSALYTVARQPLFQLAKVWNNLANAGSVAVCQYW